MAFDLTINDDDGEAWDLSRARKRRRLWSLMKQRKPLVIIGSPPCTCFSSLQNLSADKGDEATKRNKCENTHGEPGASVVHGGHLSIPDEERKNICS